jgi:hypothetical protein
MTGNKNYVELLASTTVTATSTGSAIAVPEGTIAVNIQVDVTALATDAGDHLDVYLQTTFDGTNWTDIARITQQDGNGSASRNYHSITAYGVTTYENASALGEAAGRDILGHQVRVRYVVTDAGTDDASFTFSVYGAFVSF